MKNIITCLVGVLLLLLQVTILPMMKIGWINYHLALVSVVVVTLLYEPKFSLFFAALMGFLLDVTGGLYLGYYTLVYLGASCIVLFFSKLMYNKSPVAAVLFSFFLTIAVELLTYWVFFILRGVIDNTFILSKVIFPQAFVNAGVSLIVYLIFLLVSSKLEPKQRW